MADQRIRISLLMSTRTLNECLGIVEL